MKTFNWVFIISIVSLSFFSKEAVTARSSDPIQKQLLIPSRCAQSLVSLLKLNPDALIKGVEFPVVAGEMTREGLKITQKTNLLKLEKSREVVMGPHWWDRNGSIPRKKGPRFEVSSEHADSLSSFLSIWKTLFENLTESSRAQAHSTSPVKTLYEKELCSDGNFSISISVHENETSKKNFWITLRVGEVLPDFHPKP